MLRFVFTPSDMAPKNRDTLGDATCWVHVGQCRRYATRIITTNNIKQKHNAKSKKFVTRESNPGQVDGNDLCYHYTSDEWICGRPWYTSL